MRAPRGTKLRTFSDAEDEPREVVSRSRAQKPPAKAIAARKAAGMKIGGGKIPPKIRKRLEREPLPRRTHPADRPTAKRGPTRYGDREPKAGRHDDAAEMRDARPTRSANTPEADAGTRRAKRTRTAPRE